MTDMPSNTIGEFGDTSAATAIVSGAAAIINQISPNLEPDIIAQRLQYTVDFLAPEEDKKLVSGRLNIRRAVEHISDDTLIKVDETPKTVCGKIKAATPNAKIRFFLKDENEDSVRHEIFVRDVRRISKMPDSKFTVMGMFSDDPAKPKRLTKWSSVTFIPVGNSTVLSTDKQIIFDKKPCSDESEAIQTTAAKEVEAVDLNDIQELVRRAKP